MTEINKAGDNHSLGHIDIPQGKLREQMDVVSDSLRQLGGKSEIQRGNVVNDPLNAPFVLVRQPLHRQGHVRQWRLLNTIIYPRRTLTSDLTATLGLRLYGCATL